ncbi:tRNA guanosine(34) transglycosylase Tgt [Candidatus Woesearchaeota archaeon]|nr:MAG: tRNA guanosine(34) transglycosylase Tgt [Candidatus Woesearchaeota archaeon]
MFNIKAKQGMARVGELTTPSGKRIKTPFFMPVATKGSVKFITSEDLAQMGAGAVIMNSYMLSFKPGQELIKKAGGLHAFTGNDGVIFTDSGGFQMLREELFLEITNNKVKFKNPYTLKPTWFSPETVMELQADLGSDVAMALDHVPAIRADKEEIRKACARTHLWAKRCLDHHKKLREEKGVKQLLFGIAQGGVHEDLREESARIISAMDFDGFAMGGLCIGETRESMYQAITVQAKILPENKPRYLMGVGSPEDLVEAVAHGCDCFDSIFPTQNARHGIVFTRDGAYDIKSSEFKEDFSPLDIHCSCKICKRYSRAFIHHLFRSKEHSVYQLVSYHNLFFNQQVMRECREHIKKGTFDTFRKEFIERYTQGSFKEKEFSEIK